MKEKLKALVVQHTEEALDWLENLTRYPGSKRLYEDVLLLKGQFREANRKMQLDLTGGEALEKIKLALMQVVERLDIRVFDTDAPETQARSSEQPASSFHFYQKREDIHWKPFNDRVQNRFWVCGTSLVGVSERTFLKEYLDRSVDVRMVLPDPHQSYLSYQQLVQFNKFAEHYKGKTAIVVDEQVDLARKVYHILKSKVPARTEQYLRLYPGIMYSNITLFDDDAIIAYYNDSGVGDNCFSLQFNKKINPSGYRAVEEEFLRMWDLAGQTGKVSLKKGTSLIFFNDRNEVLLFLRDNKKTIRYPNCWDILGGGVEEGETPEMCIIREMEEEIEYTLREPRLFKIYEEEDRIEHTFWQRENFDLATTPLHEGRRLKWFSEADIRKMPEEEFAFGFKSVLLDFYREKPWLSD